MISVTVTLHEISVAGIGSVSPRSVVREMFSKVPLKSPLGTSLPAFSCRVLSLEGEGLISKRKLPLSLEGEDG